MRSASGMIETCIFVWMAVVSVGACTNTDMPHRVYAETLRGCAARAPLIRLPHSCFLAKGLALMPVWSCLFVSCSRTTAACLLQAHVGLVRPALALSLLRMQDSLAPHVHVAQLVLS